MSIDNKTCTSCKAIKPLSSFHKETRGRYGVKSKCAVCITLMSKKWKSENKDRECQNRRNWNDKNKDKHKASTYKWRNENYKRHLQYVALYQQNRKNKDPNFKLLCAMRSLLYNHITRKNLKKHLKLESYIGCKFDVFIKHIESLFTDSMNWQNYGKIWSIDHICPCSQAKNEEEFAKLQHFSNLRPLLIIDNLNKSDNKTPEAENLCLRLLGRSFI